MYLYIKGWKFYTLVHVFESFFRIMNDVSSLLFSTNLFLTQLFCKIESHLFILINIKIQQKIHNIITHIFTSKSIEKFISVLILKASMSWRPSFRVDISAIIPVSCNSKFCMCYNYFETKVICPGISPRALITNY